jgi:hypothetical protein
MKYTPVAHQSVAESVFESSAHIQSLLKNERKEIFKQEKSLCFKLLRYLHSVQLRIAYTFCSETK